MTVVMVALAILALYALFMFFVRREEERNKKVKKEHKKALAERSPLLALKVGDAVEHVGQTFIVDEKLTFREGSFQWLEYKLVDGSETRWLEVEDDDELYVTLYEAAPDLHVTGEPPRTLQYQGKSFELEEKGFATMRKEGDVNRHELPECRYYDYEAPGGDVLSLEKWGENFEASVGKTLHPATLDVIAAR